MDIWREPKRKKVSIHNKYKRRLRNLSRALDRYLEMAEAKLDKSQSGNIRNRPEIERLISKSKELAGILPNRKESLQPPSAVEEVFEVGERAAQDTDEVHASEFFRGLTKEEWEELKNAFKERA